MDWPKTLADVVAWLRSRERPRLPLPPHAGPDVPAHDPDAPLPPPGKVRCAVCGSFVPKPDYTAHLTDHADRAGMAPDL